MAVIRSIDSASTCESVAEALDFHSVDFEIISGNVCLSIENLRKAISTEAFSGFDEVWIISGPPPAFDLTPLPTATSDGSDFSSGIPDELSNAVEKTRCVAIVGDGCGLNFVTTDRRIQKELVKAEQ